MALPESLDQYVHVGKITKPHGIKGEVKVLSFSGESEVFGRYNEFILADKNEQLSVATVQKCRPQGNFAIVALKGIVTRNQSEELAGMQVWVDESYLPDLSDSEFYWRDAMGSVVATKDGQIIGKLINLFDAGGSDMMVIQTDRGEVLIPGLPEFIVELSESGLVVNVPPGLLEMNEKN